MQTNKLKKDHSGENVYEFFSPEMHCAACELLVEKKLSKYPGVKKVEASLATKKIKVSGKFEIKKEHLAEELSNILQKEGYTVTTQRDSKQKIDWSEFKKAILIAGVVIAAFIVLQKMGILNTFSPDSINLPTVFMIGIVASLSSCMAVVGGLVLSISANYAKEVSSVKRTVPMVMFHISRIVSFMVLGGLLGLLGTAFAIEIVVAVLSALLIGVLVFGLIQSENSSLKFGGSIFSGIISFGLLTIVLNETFAQFLLSLLTGLVMVVLALNLLDIFDFTKKLQFKIPKRFSKGVLNTENIQSRFTPILLGAATFFLPCGFTQSMQFQALGTQSFTQGSLMMLVYALGTLPVLAGISFLSNNLVHTNKNSGVFFKTAGLIVLFFSLINLMGAFVVLGVIDPFFTL